MNSTRGSGRKGSDLAKHRHNQQREEEESSAPRSRKLDLVAPPSYGIMDLTPVGRPDPILSETEAQRRDLKRRYKALFGYKTTEQDLVKLRQTVEAAEATKSRQAIKEAVQK